MEDRIPRLVRRGLDGEDYEPIPVERAISLRLRGYGDPAMPTSSRANSGLQRGRTMRETPKKLQLQTYKLRAKPFWDGFF